MALTKYHNIVGSGAREKELVGVNDLGKSKIRGIRITNIHTTDDATINLYFYKPSTDTTDEETYYILFQYALGEKTSIDVSTGLSLDTQDHGLFNFDNSTYALFMDIGSGDTVDVLIHT